MGITLFAFVYGQVPFHDDNIVALYSKIRHQPVTFPQLPAISSKLKDLIENMLVKDPVKRIVLPDIKVRNATLQLWRDRDFVPLQQHDWVTKDRTSPMPSEEENCQLVEVTEEDVAKVITSIPKLDTLILIKHMLKKHSFQVSKLLWLPVVCNFLLFQNPFLHRRRNHRPSNPEQLMAKHHIARSGRSNSAPDSYNWTLNKQVSLDSSLEAVTEVTLDTTESKLVEEEKHVVEKRW